MCVFLCVFVPLCVRICFLCVRVCPRVCRKMEGELTCQFDGQAPSKFHVILRGLKIYFYPSKSVRMT